MMSLGSWLLVHQDVEAFTIAEKSVSAQFYYFFQTIGQYYKPTTMVKLQLAMNDTYTINIIKLFTAVSYDFS